jgi:TetR/AcrR family transcriptional regulator, mexJK operon transcriptional repressor
MNAKAGRPRDETKRAAILLAAGQCFLRDGLEGASMDSIADAAGVSKLTVYKNFQNKETLFREVISAKCREFSPPDSFLALVDQAPRAALTQIANGFLRLMLQPEVVAMHRVVIGEAGRNPRVAELLNEAGARPTLAAFSEVLKAWVKAGKLEIPATERASDHFFNMLKGHMLQEVTLNLRALPSSSEVKRHIDDCVDMFLRAYEVRR